MTHRQGHEPAGIKVSSSPEKRQVRFSAAPSARAPPSLQSAAAHAASPAARPTLMRRNAVARTQVDAEPLLPAQLDQPHPGKVVTFSDPLTPPSEKLSPAPLRLAAAPEEDSEEYSEDDLEQAVDEAAASTSTASPSASSSTSPSTPTPGRPPLLRRAPLSVAVDEGQTPVLSSASASPNPMLIPELILPSELPQSAAAAVKDKPLHRPMHSLDEQLLRLKEADDEQDAPIQKLRRKKKSKKHAMRQQPASPSVISSLQPSLASPSHSAYLAPSPSFPSLSASPSSPSFPSLSSGFTPSPSSHFSFASRFSFSEPRRSLASCNSLPQLGLQQQQQHAKMKPLSLDATHAPPQPTATHLSPPAKLFPQLSRSGSPALLPTLGFSSPSNSLQPPQARNPRLF